MPETFGFDLDAAIVDLVRRNDIHLPPFPAVAMQVSALTKAEDFGLDDVAKLIASDQVLAATVIRCANSAFYTGSAKVVTVLQAISRIGTKDLVGVAFAGTLGTEVAREGPLFLMRQSSWQRGVASAFIARALAPGRAQSTEDAFLCGLLHDFGELVALSCIERILRTHPVEAFPESTWAEVVSRYHVELGLVTAVQWQLPSVVSDVISGHHRETREEWDHPEMVALMKACDAVVSLLLHTPYVSEEELGRVPGISASEASVLTRMIPKIPQLLESLTAGKGGGSSTQSSSRVSSLSGSILLPPIREIAWPVEMRVAKDQTLPYEADLISRTGLRVRGKSPLHERRALELVLHPTGVKPLTFWIQVVRCEQVNAESVAELKPFALDREKDRQWQELLHGTHAHGEGQGRHS